MLTKGIPNNGYLNLCKMKIDVGKKGTKKKKLVKLHVTIESKEV